MQRRRLGEDDMSHEENEAPRRERRRSDRRRTYNRRQDDQEISPPYFEVFERIAVALEGIETALRGST